jgi:hypothetical protein
MLMANSPMSDAYERLWATELSVGIGDAGITELLTQPLQALRNSRFWIPAGA